MSVTVLGGREVIREIIGLRDIVRQGQEGQPQSFCLCKTNSPHARVHGGINVFHQFDHQLLIALVCQNRVLYEYPDVL